MLLKRTPKNPHGVNTGQLWGRRLHKNAYNASDLVVTKVDLRNAVAHVKSTHAYPQFGSRARVTRIKLRRFHPGAGYHLKGEAI